MDVTFLTRGHYQVRQCEFSTPAKPLPFQQHPTSKRPHTLSRSAESGAFSQHVRLPKLQKEISNVLQTSQPLPAHPIPVARRHVDRIDGHRRRRDACDTRTTPRMRRYKTNKFHCQPSFLRDARQMRPEREDGCTFVGWRRAGMLHVSAKSRLVGFESSEWLVKQTNRVTI
jgi:hypothetical protein